MDNKLNIFVKTILDMCFYFGLLAVASVPFTLKYSIQMTIRTLGEQTEYAAIADHFWYAVVIAGVFLFAGLLSKVLARVFDRAVKYKQENDLTI